MVSSGRLAGVKTALQSLLVEVAADMDMSADAMWRRRTRAERRLRLLPLAS